MITRYKFKLNTPYSLHDMRIDKMALSGSDLHLCFEHGFVKRQEPYEQVEGSITVEKLDLDFCCVELLSTNGHYGGFRGEKMELADFLERFPSFSFEVVDELLAYNQVVYSGYLSLPGVTKLREMELSLYYWGEIVYETEK